MLLLLYLLLNNVMSSTPLPQLSDNVTFLTSQQQNSGMIRSDNNIKLITKKWGGSKTTVKKSKPLCVAKHHWTTHISKPLSWNKEPNNIQCCFHGLQAWSKQQGIDIGASRSLKTRTFHKHTTQYHYSILSKFITTSEENPKSQRLQNGTWCLSVFNSIQNTVSFSEYS